MTEVEGSHFYRYRWHYKDISSKQAMFLDFSLQSPDQELDLFCC